MAYGAAQKHLRAQVNDDTRIVILENKDTSAGVKLARAVQATGGARSYVLQACPLQPDWPGQAAFTSPCLTPVCSC